MPLDPRPDEITEIPDRSEPAQVTLAAFDSNDTVATTRTFFGARTISAATMLSQIRLRRPRAAAANHGGRRTEVVSVSVRRRLRTTLPCTHDATLLKYE